MNLFKTAFKQHREDEKIRGGFGFRHLSDATQYYLHPANESFRGTTTLCQPIGEAVALFQEMLKRPEAFEETEIYYNRKERIFLLEMTISESFHQEGILEKECAKIAVISQENALLFQAYGEDGKKISDQAKRLMRYYKILFCFLILLARDFIENPDYQALFEAYTEDPQVDSFVQVNEDFYQNHKYDDYHLVTAVPEGDYHSGMNTFSSYLERIRKNRSELSLLQEIPIRRFDPDDFTEDALAQIPKLDPAYRLEPSLTGLCAAMAEGDILSVLFHGPSGTGKTMAAKLICEKMGLPLLEVVNCTENLDEFILGKYIPKGNAIVFEESGITRAIREGGAVVFEEINFARPQYLSFLNSLLDDNGFVRLDSGEIVRRHPHFRFFATMNIGYFGTRDLNQALFNRFSAVREISRLPDEAIRRMLTARVPESIPQIDAMLFVYRKIEKIIRQEKQDCVISPRNLENWGRLAKYEGYLKAAESTLIPVCRGDQGFEAYIRQLLIHQDWEGEDA